MTAKSIIEIDVQDDRFQNFLAAFQLYKEALGEMPEDWRAQAEKITGAGKAAKELAGEADAIAGQFNNALSELQQMNQQMGVLVANTANLNRQGDAFKRGADGAKSFLEGGARAAGKMATEIKDATVSMLKWTSVLGLFGGLIGAGGLFGINRLALGAGAQRFSAQGLNTTAGGLASTATNFTPALANPVGTLGNIRDAQQDLSRRWVFTSMGVNPQGDPAQMLPELIRNARNIFNQTGGTLQGAEARGLTQIFTLEDLNRFKNMSDAEIEAMAKRADADRRTFDITDRSLKQWQDFDVQVNRSEQEIRKAFITGLSPLAPQLSQLSQAVAGFLTHMLQSPQVGQWIDMASNGLKNLGEYLTSSDFQRDADEFITAVGKLGRAVANVVTWIGNKFGGDGSTASAGGEGLRLAPTLLGPDREATLTGNGLVLRDNTPGATRADRNNNPLNLTKSPLAIGSDGRFSQFADPATGFQAAAYQLHRYAAGLTFGAPVDTVHGIVNKWAPKADNNDTEAYIKTVIQMMNRDGSTFSDKQHLNLSDPDVMSKLLAAMSRAEGSRNNYTAEQVKVMITNATGGNAIVTTSMLGK